MDWSVSNESTRKQQQLEPKASTLHAILELLLLLRHCRVEDGVHVLTDGFEIQQSFPQGFVRRYFTCDATVGTAVSTMS